MKSRWELAHVVAVAHPDRELVVKAPEEPIGLADREQRRTILPRVAGIDLAAEVVGDQLHPVADAEHRDPGLKRLWINLRSSGLVNACGPSAEDQTGGSALFQLGPRRRPGHELAVDVRLPHAPRDQLAELRTKVEDENRLLPWAALHLFLFAVLGGRGGHAQLSSSPCPHAGPAGRPCPPR